MDVNNVYWKHWMLIGFLLLLGPLGVLIWFFIDLCHQQLPRWTKWLSFFLVLILNIFGLLVYYVWLRNGSVLSTPSPGESARQRWRTNGFRLQRRLNA